jgi:hypothetical protein
VFTTITLGDRVSTIDLRVDVPVACAARALIFWSTVRTGGRVASVDVRVFHPDDAARTVATGRRVRDQARRERQRRR